MKVSLSAEIKEYNKCVTHIAPAKKKRFQGLAKEVSKKQGTFLTHQTFVALTDRQQNSCICLLKKMLTFLSQKFLSLLTFKSKNEALCGDFANENGLKIMTEI